MALFKILSITLLATLASCEPPVPGYNYHAPGNSFGTNYQTSSTGYNTQSNSYLPPSSGTSGHGSYDHTHSHNHPGHENEVPKSYEFGYSVKDAQSGNDYGRRESSDGNVVRGEYRVQLPDGRTQIVTYHADWQTGFHADVRYEGEARYPEPAPSAPQQGGYNYNAPSDFAGSLTGFHGNQGFKQPSSVYGTPAYH